MRAETGVMKFQGDWGGYFLRGDDVLRFVLSYRDAQAGSPIHKVMFEAMLKDMESCLGSDTNVVDNMKPFEECKL